MYEVEYKVEITKEERDKLIEKLLETGFLNKGVVSQNDFYTEVRFSPDGGYDFCRYRKEGGKFIFTEKVHEMHEGKKIRKETEREVSESEFLSHIKNSPDCVKIIKERESFQGSWKDIIPHVDMDSVKFDHSASERYFVEAEVLTEDKASTSLLREKVQAFLEAYLEHKVTEAPGMFSLAYKKL
jgi:adenylate cyclase class IV